MAIKLTPIETPSRLFCGSKFCGDPDMPEDMEYPMLDQIPLTFICQIDCADLAPYDKDGIFPEDGMFYFFGAIDYFLGYESPIRIPIGEWPKGYIVVKYAKSINYETFQSQIMLDENDEPIAQMPLAIEFSECADDEDCLRMGGRTQDDTIPDGRSLLHLVTDALTEFTFPDGMSLEISLSANDIKFGNWKRGQGYLAD